MTTATNPIPVHLRRYVTEAIESGLRDPREILEAAVVRCNKVANEMIEGKSRRAQIVCNAMGLDVWAAAN